MNLKQINFSSILKSDRVVLRRLLPDDSSVLYEIYSHEQSALLDDWIPFTNIKEAEDMIVDADSGFANRSEIRYGIVDVKSNRLVGCCGFFGLDEWNSKCILFYQVHHNEQNRGYATESVRLLIEYIFNELGFNRVEAYITPGNDGSIRVLEKNGFAREGLLREMEFYKNRYWDGIVMGMLKKDFKAD